MTYIPQLVHHSATVASSFSQLSPFILRDTTYSLKGISKRKPEQEKAERKISGFYGMNNNAPSLQDHDRAEVAICTREN